MKTPRVDKAPLLHSDPRMRIAGLCVVLGSFLVGCSTGSSGPGSGPPVAGGTVDAGSEMTQEGILCSTFYKATGTFVPDTSNPPPAGFTGCWPVGAWKFSLAINTDASSGGGADTCAAASKEPTPLSMYQFTGTTMPDADGDPAQHFTYVAQASDPNVNSTIKVTEGGSGICQGSLALYDSTGTKVWSLQPELNADNSVTGSAEYDLFGTDQWGGN